MPPKLMAIDHIHIYVPNKQQAADWYIEHLGLRIAEPLLIWNDKSGPLTLEDELGTIHLALFNRKEYTPLTAIAFKTSGEEFIRWKVYLEQHNLLLRCSDHSIAWSLYFKDPFGHSHEITTYDYNLVSKNCK